MITVQFGQRDGVYTVAHNWKQGLLMSNHKPAMHEHMVQGTSCTLDSGANCYLKSGSPKAGKEIPYYPLVVTG